MKARTQFNYLIGKSANLFMLGLASLSIPLIDRILPPGRYWLHDIKRTIEGDDATVIFDVGANTG